MAFRPLHGNIVAAASSELTQRITAFSRKSSSVNQRFDICDGDTTTSGGRVFAGLRVDLLNGRSVAYEGDQVSCPKCDTMGWILCVGERLPNRGANGREQALSYDWCVCKCDPKPLLIPSQSQSGMRA